RADEHEAREQLALVEADLIAVPDAPEAVAALLEADDARLGGELRAAAAEHAEQGAREGAEVDIRSRGDAGRGDRLRLETTGNQQRRPRADDAGVVAELHTGEQRVV